MTRTHSAPLKNDGGNEYNNYQTEGDGTNKQTKQKRERRLTKKQKNKALYSQSALGSLLSRAIISDALRGDRDESELLTSVAPCSTSGTGPGDGAV